MIFWGLAGGFGTSMGWSVLTENYAFNIAIGSGLGESVQAGAQFLVSNSGILFEGLGYSTIAGGGGFLTYDAIKGINNKDINYSSVNNYTAHPFINLSEKEAVDWLVHLSKINQMEMLLYLTEYGYVYDRTYGYEIML